jgi:hypothetical protein
VALENCAAVLREALAQYNGELLSLTGIDSASKVKQLLAWLRDRSVYLDSLDEESVETALAGPIHDAAARRVLEIRAAIGSASVKKVFSMLNMAGENDRLHDLFVYPGARTGRCTGEGPQPTNLPKAGPATYRCGCGKFFGAHRPTCPFCGAVIAPTAKRLEWTPEAAEQAIEVLAYFKDTRGFHLFDLERRELEFISNPNTMFERVEYDDKDCDPIDLDLIDLTGKYVKLVVVNKTDYYKFDKFIQKLYNKGCYEIKIIEDFSEFEEGQIDEEINLEDTVSVLSNYVDSIETDVDKEQIKTFMRTLYTEAVNQEVV